MTKRELIDMIENDCCNGDIQETIESVNELINDIHINPNKFINDLTEELEKYARDDNNRCEICGYELRESNSKEYSDCRGWEVAEDFRTNECTNPDCENY